MGKAGKFKTRFPNVMLKVSAGSEMSTCTLKGPASEVAKADEFITNTLAQCQTKKIPYPTKIWDLLKQAKKQCER